MRWRGIALVAAGSLAVTAGNPASPAEPAPPSKTYTVTIEGMAYSPAKLVVHRGDRIVWVNQDLFPHTVSAVGKEFDSGSIAQSASWSYVAGKAGDFTYTCQFHPTMKGELQVH